MTVEEIKAKVAAIDDMSGDAEAAHSEEDDLRDAVLKAIAEGAPNAEELAREVLETGKLDFPRWCA